MDGTTVSVQASSVHYCNPRNNDGPWTALEVGYPSAPVSERWADFIEAGPDAPLNQIYAFVPAIEVEFYLAAHGGIDFEKTVVNFVNATENWYVGQMEKAE